jgi:hypothetical protein
MRNGLYPALMYAVLCLSLSRPALAHTADFIPFGFDDESHFDDAGDGEGYQLYPVACTAANAAQRAAVNEGNTKAGKFLRLCREAAANSGWCEQLMRPNPSSRSVFNCTYGSSQPHQLIHPDENTWGNAIKAVQIIQDLESLGVRVAQIYNWWRPEPYNANVGGSKTRHPFGTSVDVRFASLPDMEKAHKLLCEFRRKGRLRALGYYGSTGLHFGVGDTNPNTWGKACP